jgi:Zn-dependent protease
VTAAGASFFPRDLFFNLLALGLAITFFAMGFLLHELAHKFVAQNYGLWAEFRVDRFGAMITLLSLLSPIKLIAPGAVMIQGPISKRAVGLTSVAGPLTNIVISAILLVVSQSAALYWVPIAEAAAAGATINAWLALFNMIPFSVFDGRKAFWWNKLGWGLVTGAALALVYLTRGLLF